MAIDYKKDFPIFETNPGLVYLDNAATTHKPHGVIEALVDFYTHLNSNVHRGIYPLSEAATEVYELARRKVAGFIGAAPEETIFTAGTTDSLNMLATMLINSELVPKNPYVVTTEAEHHSNILPWQQISDQIDYIPLNSNFELALDEVAEDGESYADKIARADIVAVSAISNVTGARVDLKKLRQQTKSLLIVDGAQLVGHEAVDVKDSGIDFLAFGGHKMYGPMGIGVLYGRKELLQTLNPGKVGGGMINKVNRDKSTWAPLPEKFEAGTPSVADAVGLAAAIDFIQEIGWDEIQNHERDLAQKLDKRLRELPEVTLYHPANVAAHAGVFSFTVDSIHPHDIAQVLGDQKICVRAGHHCTQILHREVLQIPSSARASLAVYNDSSDIDKLIAGIKDTVVKFE